MASLAVSTPAEAQKFEMAVRSNMLYDAALVPNVGVEFHMAKRWSLGADAMYAGWKNDGSHRYWCVSGAEVNLRHYFGPEKNGHLSGHHLGVYGQIGSYDFEFGGKGQKSDRYYGAGIEYGYSLSVAKNINIDFSLGVGYFGGKYEKYEPRDDHYVWQETHRRTWLGPTSLEIAFMWKIKS